MWEEAFSHVGEWDPAYTVLGGKSRSRTRGPGQQAEPQSLPLVSVGGGVKGQGAVEVLEGERSGNAGER